jgi:hypothetical protein
MIEDDGLSYIPWEACTKRSQELEGQRVLKEYRPTATGYLKEVAKTDDAIADVSSDLRLKYALQRRSIALDIANVLSFHEHEKFVNKVIGELLRTPPQGYRRVSLDQLMRLDRELWSSLAQRTRQGLTRPANGSNPLDAIFMPVFQEASVQLLLLPLPASSASGRPPAAAHDDSPVSKRALKRQRQAEAKQRTEDAPSKRPRGADSGKPAPSAMPKGLEGMARSAPDGSNICFAFNLQGCDKAKDGKRCRRGLHVCARPGCHGAHSLKACPQA